MIPEDEKKQIENAIEHFISYNQLIPELLVTDRKLINLKEKLSKWLEPIPSQDRLYFLHLFKYFQYFDRLKIIAWFEESYNKYINSVSQSNDTLFVPVCSFGGVMNGAISLFDCMIEAEVNLSKNKMAAQPRDFYDENIISNFQNIVLIDDIVGSGDTLIDFIERTQITCEDFFLDKCIFVLPILCLDKGKENVLEYSKEVGLNLQFLESNSINKIFSNTIIYPNPEHGKEAKKVIKQYEENVASKPVYTWGYKRSETLAAFYFNTPNNTLSTFHEKNDSLPWNPVFPRRKNGDELIVKDSSTLFEIRKRKEQRRNIKHQLAIKAEEEKRNRD